VALPPSPSLLWCRGRNSGVHRSCPAGYAWSSSPRSPQPFVDPTCRGVSIRHRIPALGFALRRMLKELLAWPTCSLKQEALPGGRWPLWPDLAWGVPLLWRTFCLLSPPSLIAPTVWPGFFWLRGALGERSSENARRPRCASWRENASNAPRRALCSRDRQCMPQPRAALVGAYRVFFRGPARSVAKRNRAHPQQGRLVSHIRNRGNMQKTRGNISLQHQRSFDIRRRMRFTQGG
jgi:hypothetical protein